MFPPTGSRRGLSAAPSAARRLPGEKDSELCARMLEEEMIAMTAAATAGSNRTKAIFYDTKPFFGAGNYIFDFGIGLAAGVGAGNPQVYELFSNLSLVHESIATHKRDLPRGVPMPVWWGPPRMDAAAGAFHALAAVLLTSGATGSRPSRPTSGRVRVR